MTDAKRVLMVAVAVVWATSCTGGSNTTGAGGGGASTGGSTGAGGGATGGTTGSGGTAPGGRSGTGGGANGGVVGSGGATVGGHSGAGGAATGGTGNLGGSAGASATGGAAGGGTGGAGGTTVTTCPSNGWAPGRQTINMQWDGVARQYVVYVPKSYQGTSAVPLMMVIHGAHNTPALVESWSQMDAVSEQNGFIIVYPAALDCWKVGTTVLPGCTTADDDVGFLSDVVTEVESHACIDQKRVYVTGISNGSLMSQYMGCHFADVFAAVGGVAGGEGCSAPARPLPIFYVLGTADMTVGWDNGANALAWAKRDNCNTTPVTVYNQGSTLCTVYQGCDQGVEVEFCAVTGMPHCWPDNCYLDPNNMMFQAFKASPPMWQFFSQYSLP